LEGLPEFVAMVEGMEVKLSGVEWSGALGFGGEWSLVLLLCLSVCLSFTSGLHVALLYAGFWVDGSVGCIDEVNFEAC
jgi:hypothetical protein